MTNRIKSRDWEALSAYLDGQLSTRERTRLETRLRSDSELQAALEELRQTRGVLRRLPRFRVPRNFILTPEMVQLKRDTPRIFPVLRFASVLAMILLAFVVIGDIMIPSAPGLSPAMETAFDVYAPPQMAEKVAEIQEEAEAYPSELGFEAPAAEALTDEVEGESRAPVMKVPVPTPTALPTSVVAMPYPTVEEAFSPQESVVKDNTAGNSVFRILEIGLAIIAIGAGIAAFVLRRGTVG